MLTASIGLSFANFAIFAKSSLRFSGGKMLSMKAWTLFPTPLNVPWRVPVRPVIASAIVGVAVVVCCSWWCKDFLQAKRRSHGKSRRVEEKRWL